MDIIRLLYTFCLVFGRLVSPRDGASVLSDHSASVATTRDAAASGVRTLMLYPHRGWAIPRVFHVKRLVASLTVGPIGLHTSRNGSMEELSPRRGKPDTWFLHKV
jgi:hypothetical protein